MLVIKPFGVEAQVDDFTAGNGDIGKSVFGSVITVRRHFYELPAFIIDITRDEVALLGFGIAKGDDRSSPMRANPVRREFRKDRVDVRKGEFRQGFEILFTNGGW